MEAPLQARQTIDIAHELELFALVDYLSGHIGLVGGVRIILLGILCVQPVRAVLHEFLPAAQAVAGLLHSLLLVARLLNVAQVLRDLGRGFCVFLDTRFLVDDSNLRLADVVV